MKEKLLTDFISELLSIKELQYNNVANVLTQYCTYLNITTRENCYEDIIKFYHKTSNNNSLNFFQQSIIKNVPDKKDYRINSIQVKNIKCLDCNSEELPFGISFNEEKKPLSCIIYGTNGIGKSAIFGTLEYIFSNKVSEYQARTYKESSDNGLAFLAHNGNVKNAFCKIDTVDKTLYISDNGFLNENIFFAQNCFINDATVTDNGLVDYESSNDYSAHILIANSMGLTQLTDIETVFTQMSSYNRQKEKREFAISSNAIKQSRELINQWNNRTDIINQQLKELKASGSSVFVDQESAKLSFILENIVSTKIECQKNANKLEDRARDFLVAYQQLSEIENYSSSEHHFELINHAKEILNTNKLNVCPLCKTAIDTDKLFIDIELDVANYQTQMSKKKATEETMNLFYDEIEYLIDLHSEIETNINQTTIQLSKYSQFISCVTILKRVSELLKAFKSNDYVNTIISIKSSGDSAEQLNRLLYYELENLITIANHTFEQITDLVDAFYAKLDVIINNDNFETQIDNSKQTSRLEQELDYLATQISQEQIHLYNLNQANLQVKQKLDLQTSITEQIKTLTPYIRSIVNKKVIDTFTPIKKTIEMIMEQFLEDDKCRLDISFDNEYICFHIITSEGIRIVPSLYFNTFRYKLFCTALSFSLAMLMRKKINVNLPLVFDDPFTGFDTTNRDQMLTFVRKMTKIAQHFSSEQNPIQVITFTHNWQLFQILRSALQSTQNTRFQIMDNHRLAHKNQTYYELTRKV